MKHVCRTLLIAPLLVCCCGGDVGVPKAGSGSYSYSFENGMEGWTARGIDLELGDGLIEWSIEPTTEKAKEGDVALELYLENWNDAGKIWIERAFEIRPGRSYKAELKYWFCTADFGMANLWTIISGVVPERPETREDLVYQGHTGNGADSDIGYKWIEKTYSFSVEPDSDGTVHALVGVWGNWETPRRYYLDCLSITFTEL